MKYNTLTKTAFLWAAQNGSLDEMTDSYGAFIDKVVEVCGCRNGKTAAVAALLYTEIELKAMGDGNPLIAKAATFISEMQKMVEQMPASEITEAETPKLNWTGDIVNLVELVYGLIETGCVNDGNITIEKLGNALFGLFGLEPKPYSRAYTTIKRRVRENGGRTYFLTEMRRQLEERIDQNMHLYLRK